MGLISRHSIDAVVEANDIVEVVSSYVMLDKKSALNHFGLCPFHEEKTPSFSVSPGKQIFYCFGCQKGGNVIKFIQEIEHLSYPEAIRFLAERAGVAIEETEDDEWKERYSKRQKAYEALNEAAGFYYQSLESDPGREARDYLARRGVDRRLYRRYGLGYAPSKGDSLYRHLRAKGIPDEAMLDAGLILPSQRQDDSYYDFFRHRVMFPIIDTAGRVLAFGGRAMVNKGPKYINTSETLVYHKGRHLFGMPQAAKSESHAFLLVEGYMDVLALARAGITSAVAPLGTALTAYQAKLIGRYKEAVSILMDSDRAGIEAALRAGERLDEAGIRSRYILLKGAKDPDDYLQLFGRERLLAALDETYDRTGYRLALLKQQTEDSIGVPKRDYRDKALDLLAQEPDSTRRELYGGHLAKALHISRRAVTEEIERRRNLLQKEEGTASGQEEVRLVKGVKAKDPSMPTVLELTLLVMLANNNRLVDLGPNLQKELPEGYALNDEVRELLMSDALLSGITESDFNGTFAKGIAAQSIRDAGDGILTAASLHTIVDNILVHDEKEDEPGKNQENDNDPDRVHSAIQQQFHAIEESRLSPEAERRVYQQKLSEQRLVNWRREASRLNEMARELELEGQDEDAGEYYARAATLTTAAFAYRMMLRGEERL
ncbi:MAG: DNA primase [Clostridiales bacterium]|nr:DNA primase [Clostridiales bacterium]